MYFWILAFLFIAVPAAELSILIQAGKAWGMFNTFALIIFTGVLGAAMARSEGARVISAMQTDLSAGRMPAPHIIDGLMVLAAGLLLITPGFLTDMIGFMLLVPGVRNVVRKVLLRFFQRRLQQGTIDVTYWEWK